LKFSEIELSEVLFSDSLKVIKLETVLVVGHKNMRGPDIPDENIFLMKSQYKLNKLFGNFEYVLPLDVMLDDFSEVGLGIFHNAIEGVFLLDDFLDFGDVFALGVFAESEGLALKDVLPREGLVELFDNEEIRRR
jgi:hypothetical protein